jgi:hypothetical protein
MKNCGSQPSGRKQDTKSWCISSSLDMFWSTTRLSIASNLVSILVCYPIFGWYCFYTPNSWHVRIPHGVCSVMVLRLVLHGATTKPRASCGARHKVVLLGTRRYQGLLVMIHYRATPMCYLLVNLFLDVVPYLVRRSVPQIKIFSLSEIGIWIVGYNLFIMLI